MSSFFHRRFQPRQQLIHVIRQRSLEFTITLRFGMNETEGLCMKHLPLDHWFAPGKGSACQERAECT